MTTYIKGQPLNTNLYYHRVEITGHFTGDYASNFNFTVYIYNDSSTPFDYYSLKSWIDQRGSCPMRGYVTTTNSVVTYLANYIFVQDNEIQIRVIDFSDTITFKSLALFSINDRTNAQKHQEIHDYVTQIK